MHDTTPSTRKGEFTHSHIKQCSNTTQLPGEEVLIYKHCKVSIRDMRSISCELKYYGIISFTIIC